MRLIIAVGMILVGILLVASQTSGNVGQVIMPTATIDPNLPPERWPIQLSTDYQDELVHYATVERVDGVVRRLYISPQAIDAVRTGEALPDGTQIVIEAYRPEDGDNDDRRLDPEIHVAESRSTWEIADLSASSRVGNWNFGAFNANNGYAMPEVGLNDCFSCHESVSNRNFLFSNPQLQQFAETGEVQYSYCSRPGRAICR